METQARLLAGRYRMGPLLGEGAVGTVSRAFDELLGRDVAIKLLKPALAQDPAALARFIAEARAAAQLVDPHIVWVFDVLPDAAHAIVMEYVDGPTLAQVMRERGRLPEAQALSIARGVSHALAVAHAHGVLHRDVKPANILLPAAGGVKVADFGLAKAAADDDAGLTLPGRMLGTTAYVSPEQAQGLPLTPASDLYSVGVILFQMLAGRLPFDASSPLAAAVAHVTQPVPALDALEQSMSPSLAAIVHRLLHKDPAARFASAHDLETALGALEGSDLAQRAAWDAPTVVGAPAVPPAPPPRRAVDGARIVAALSALESRASTAARRRPNAALALGALLAAAIVAFTAWAAHPRPFALADLRRAPLADARSRLAAAGLQPVVDERPSDDVPAGRIQAQQPAPGSRVVRGSVVHLTASSGPRLVTIPDLRGRQYGAARRAIAGFPLHAAFAARISAAPPNTVIEQYPGPGSAVRSGAPELVVISAGPAPRVIAVPPRSRHAHRPSGGGGDQGD